MKLKENTYWNNKGRYQKEQTALWDELIPDSGASKTLQGEILRAAGRLYYRFYNDGDMVYSGTPDPSSSVKNAWGFLYNLTSELCSSNEVLVNLRVMMIDLTNCRGDEELYAEILEKLVDLAVRYAADSEPIENTRDCMDDKYSDICEEMVDFQDEDEEDDDDYEEDWEDDDEEDE